jgi:hypothetical protein
MGSFVAIYEIVNLCAHIIDFMHNGVTHVNYGDGDKIWEDICCPSTECTSVNGSADAERVKLELPPMTPCAAYGKAEHEV